MRKRREYLQKLIVVFFYLMIYPRFHENINPLLIGLVEDYVNPNKPINENTSNNSQYSDVKHLKKLNKYINY